MPIQVGTYLQNGKKLVQVLAIGTQKVLGTTVPKYVCEDVSAPTDRAADIVNVSYSQVKDKEWKEVDKHAKATT